MDNLGGCLLTNQLQALRLHNKLVFFISQLYNNNGVKSKTVETVQNIKSPGRVMVNKNVISVNALLNELKIMVHKRY